MSNSNTNLQTQSSNALHNAIMEAGSKDSPTNVAPGIDNDIYSTVDACPNACEMWKAIERLKQGESINVQDLETNLYWEFGKFTSRDGESLESYYSRFYKMMNELVRNQCNVTNHQVNVQFLLQLQPEWQRFVTLVKQSQELKTVSYHKLYDILKQHQNEVNEIRTERLARTANPLALVAQQQPVYHHQNHPTQNTQYSSTRSQQSTRNRGKAIVTSSAPTYDPEPATVTEDEEMSKEKEIDKLMALISLSFKKIYKPTNNNLRTSSNTSRANQDNSPRTNRGTGYDNQRAINVAGARENVGTPVVQKSGIQCYNCKEYGHVSRECQKPKRVKDAAYHKEKMLLCKQEEAGVQLNAEQADWKDDTDDESDDQELEAHYMYMAQLQEVTPDPVDNSGPIFDDEPMHKLVEIILFIVDSGCSKHMTGNLKLLTNFVEKFLGTVKFGNDQIAPILGYGDLVQGAITIKRVYYVEGLNHNLFSVGQFCDADLEVAFRKSSCYIRDLKGNDLLTGSRGTDLYSITLQDSTSPNPICLMAKATSSQAWLWHRRLSHLNFDTINLLSKNNIVNGLPKLRKLIVQKLRGFNFLKKAQRANPRLYDIGCYNDNLALMLAPDSDKTIHEFTDLQCDYGETLEKCERLEKELSNSRKMSKSIESLQKHAINLELDLQQLATMVVPVSTSEPKHNVTKSVATSSTKTVATDSTVKKSRNITRKLYEQVTIEINSIHRRSRLLNKHMAGNLNLLTNFVEKFLGTVKFGNVQIAPILGYRDLVQGTITIKRVYYVEGLNHNLFLPVGKLIFLQVHVARFVIPFLCKTHHSQSNLLNGLKQHFSRHGYWHLRLSH
ncbi:integrase, catalytic region, zinc finger, CCHC-type containing protein [Tanacetum coccineum]